MCGSLFTKSQMLLIKVCKVRADIGDMSWYEIICMRGNTLEGRLPPCFASGHLQKKRCAQSSRSARISGCDNFMIIYGKVKHESISKYAGEQSFLLNQRISFYCTACLSCFMVTSHALLVRDHWFCESLLLFLIVLKKLS